MFCGSKQRLPPGSVNICHVQVVELVTRQITRIKQPSYAAILGNHDAWFQEDSNPAYPESLEGVRLQLEGLGDHHVGYAARSFDSGRHPAFSVVGGRPFSHVRSFAWSLRRQRDP